MKKRDPELSKGWDELPPPPYCSYTSELPRDWYLTYKNNLKNLEVSETFPIFASSECRQRARTICSGNNIQAGPFWLPYEDIAHKVMSSVFYYFIFINSPTRQINNNFCFSFIEFFVSLHRSYPRLWVEMGGTATYWKASLMLCFWLSETSTNDRPVKSNSGGECYGCSIYSRSVPRANFALMHTFRVHYILTGVGIQTLFVHWSGCGRPQIAERAGEDTPLFVCRH